MPSGESRNLGKTFLAGPVCDDITSDLTDRGTGGFTFAWPFDHLQSWRSGEFKENLNNVPCKCEPPEMQAQGKSTPESEGNL